MEMVTVVLEFSQNSSHIAISFQSVSFTQALNRNWQHTLDVGFVTLMLFIHGLKRRMGNSYPGWGRIVQKFDWHKETAWDKVYVGAGWTRSCDTLISGGVWWEAVLIVRISLYALLVGQGQWGTKLYWKKICFPLSCTICLQFCSIADKMSESTELHHQKYGIQWNCRQRLVLKYPKVPPESIIRALKQPRCGLTTKESKDCATSVIRMLLNLLPVKVPPVLCSFPPRMFQSSLDHQGCLDVSECGSLPQGFQAGKEWGKPLKTR